MAFRNRMICDIKCLQHQQLEDIVFQWDFLVLQRGSLQRMKTTRGNGARERLLRRLRSIRSIPEQMKNPCQRKGKTRDSLLAS